MSQYFDTLNREKLLKLLRETVKDERVIQPIKRILKNGELEKDVKMTTTEENPPVGLRLPLLANAYLNESDWKHEKRDMPVIR